MFCGLSLLGAERLAGCAGLGTGKSVLTQGSHFSEINLN